MTKNILIIGLGPHCRRIYIRGLKKYHLKPLLIVELQSKMVEVQAFLKKEGIECDTFFIPDEFKDENALNKWTKDNLDKLIKKNKITHAIISTEPKAHQAYLKYLITRQIATLTDKPITSPVDVANSEKQARKIQSDYLELLLLQKKFGTPVTVQCQRRYDKRYNWITSQIQSIMKEYALPISHIEIAHCDGSLNMPDEFFTRENHPYKYGYGKLFHSGYHFVDLLTFLLSYETLPKDKRPTDCLVTSIHYAPQDQLLALNEEFYRKYLKQDNYQDYYERWRQNEYAQMGELDILALCEFSRGGKVLTTCSLNLLQSGFSRRAWCKLPDDTYKGNGRVRHESVSLHLGPLMNIQVHSYQAYEVKERDNKNICHDLAGGLEHFDIHIFRNSDIIGGKPHEVIRGSDIFTGASTTANHFIGYNEHARDICLDDFLEGRNTVSTLENQTLTIDLITHAYLSVCRKRKGKAPVSKFKIASKTEENSNAATELYSGLHRAC